MGGLVRTQLLQLDTQGIGPRRQLRDGRRRRRRACLRSTRCPAKVAVADRSSSQWLGNRNRLRLTMIVAQARARSRPRWSRTYASRPDSRRRWASSRRPRAGRRSSDPHRSCRRSGSYLPLATPVAAWTLVPAQGDHQRDRGTSAAGRHGQLGSVGSSPRGCGRARCRRRWTRPPADFAVRPRSSTTASPSSSCGSTPRTPIARSDDPICWEQALDRARVHSAEATAP